MQLEAGGSWEWTAPVNRSHEIQAFPEVAGRLRVLSPRYVCKTSAGVSWSLPFAETDVDLVELAVVREPLDILLRRATGRIVGGRVSSALLPVRGVSVRLVPRRERRGWVGPMGRRTARETVMQARTDERAVFSFDGVPQLPLALSASRDGITVERRLDIDADWIDVRLNACPTVSGILTDEAGVALPRRTVCLEGAPAGLFQCVTGSDGGFAFKRVPFGDSRLGVRASGQARDLVVDSVEPITNLTLEARGPRRSEIARALKTSREGRGKMPAPPHRCRKRLRRTMAGWIP